MLPGTISPVSNSTELGSEEKSEGGLYRKFTPIVSVQFEEQGSIAVKVAQALTFSSMLSAHVGAEQTTSVTRTIKNLRIKDSSPHSLGDDPSRAWKPREQAESNVGKDSDLQPDSASRSGAVSRLNVFATRLHRFATPPPLHCRAGEK